MTDKQVPFKNLVLSHYRRAGNADELAALCGYGVYSFKRIFKNEFDMSVHQWLIRKRAENIKFRLLQEPIPLYNRKNEMSILEKRNVYFFAQK